LYLFTNNLRKVYFSTFLGVHNLPYSFT